MKNPEGEKVVSQAQSRGIIDRRTLLRGLAATVGLGIIGVTTHACASPESERVNLSVLLENPEKYQGRQIVTEGYYRPEKPVDTQQTPIYNSDQTKVIVGDHYVHQLRTNADEISPSIDIYGPKFREADVQSILPPNFNSGDATFVLARIRGVVISSPQSSLPDSAFTTPFLIDVGISGIEILRELKNPEASR